MKYNTNVVIVSAGLVILGLYYFNKQRKQNAELAQDTTNSSSSSTTSAKADWNKVLKKGSKGQEVGILQKALKQLKVDNDFGSATETRLKNVMKVTQTSLNDYNKFIKNK